jgi:hypothetical protein
VVEKVGIFTLVGHQADQVVAQAQETERQILVVVLETLVRLRLKRVSLVAVFRVTAVLVLAVAQVAQVVGL